MGYPPRESSCGSEGLCQGADLDSLPLRDYEQWDEERAIIIERMRIPLDVFEEEPLAADHALRRYERLIFGSHNASNTVEAVRRTSLKALDEMARLLSAAKEEAPR